MASDEIISLGSARNGNGVGYTVRTRIIINERELRYLKADQRGPTAIWLRYLGEKAKVRARLLAKQRLTAKVRARLLAKQRLTAKIRPKYSDWHRPGNDGFGNSSKPPGRTGYYDTQFYYRVIPNKDTLKLVVGNSAPYASAVELGALRGGDYPIYPTKGPYLNYYSNSLRRYVKRDGVMHPGPWGSGATNPYRNPAGKGARVLTDTHKYILGLKYTRL